MYQLVTLPDKWLRSKAENVLMINAGLRNELDRMVETMLNEGGVGLAAPQVGISLRMFVMQLGPDDPIYKVINPRVLYKSKETSTAIEGCLSVPGKGFLVSRAKHLAIEYLSEQGKLENLQAEGMLARVVQHEIDHLDGRLICCKRKDI